MKKVDRALYGPSLTEIVLGASLSVVLGVVLGLAYLIFKPVATVREIPKDAPADAVYYIPGSRNGSNMTAISAKRKALAGGQSITLSEDEINALANQLHSSSPMKSKPATPAAGAKPEPAAQSDVFVAGAPNIRLRESEMQVVVPVKISLLGIEQDVLVQTRGPFVKRDGGFVFDPAKLWIGSCPAGRLPGVTALVMRKVLLARPVPDDIATAWAKLDEVSVVGTALKLAMP